MGQRYHGREIRPGQQTNHPTFYAYDAAGGTAINASYTDITLDTEVIKNDVFAHSDDSAVITVPRATAGYYEINATVCIDGTTTTRSTSETILVKNGTAMEGAVGYAYHRTTADGEGCCTINHIEWLEPGDAISMQSKILHGGAMSTCANACRIYIRRISL